MASRALSIEQLTRTSFGKLGCNKSIHTCFQKIESDFICQMDNFEFYLGNVFSLKCGFLKF